MYINYRHTKRIIGLILFFLQPALFAQTNIDSLVNVLQNDKLSVEEKISAYNEICYYYNNSDPQKARSYIQEALSLAEKEASKSWMSIFNAYLAKTYEIEGKYDTALNYYTKALQVAVEGNIAHQQAYVYNSMASTYYRQGNIVTALDLMMKALSIYETKDEDKYKMQVVLILTNIGGIYRSLENQDVAIPYLQRAENMVEELDYPAGRMGVHYELGDIYRDKKEYDKALDHTLKALEISRSIGNRSSEFATLGVLALIYKGTNDYEKSEQHASEALAIAEKMGNPAMLLHIWHVFANIYNSQERYFEGEKAGMKAWQIDSSNVDMAPLITYNLGWSNIYLGNKDRAMYYFEKYREITNQLSNKNFQNLLIDTEIKYETEKKEIRISVLEKEQKLYIVLGVAAAFALLSVIGLLFYRHRLSSQKRKIAEQQIKQMEREKELIAARAALDAEKTEREIIARDLHDGVGAMLSVVKNNMTIMKSYSIIENEDVNYFNKALDGLDKSIDELRRVAHHIMPGALISNGLTAALDDFCRSIPKVEFHFAESNQRFDPEKELVLYRCAYESINNALRHANASCIDVNLNMDEQVIYLSVVDDGCGFDPQIALPGMGINNMRTRLSAFGGRMEIYSEQGKGTEVNIELNL